MGKKISARETMKDMRMDNSVTASLCGERYEQKIMMKAISEIGPERGQTAHDAE
jgi:hypothetical protein